MINTQLPVFFNTNLHRKLGPELLADIKAKLADPEEKKWIHNPVYMSMESPGGDLFKALIADTDVEFITILQESASTPANEKSELRSTLEGLYGKIIYDYYRENTFDESEITNKKADVYLEPAAKIIQEVQEKTYKSWMNVLEGIVACCEIDPKSGTVKIGKEKPQIIFKAPAEGVQPETETTVKQKFTQVFTNLMKSHLAFIPIKKKIEGMNKIFRQIKEINTTKELKKYMLIHFYDLVYAISITANFVSYEEAKKIIEY